MLLAITFFIAGALILVAAVFLGFHLTGSKRVKLSASWKSVEVEIERPDTLPQLEITDGCDHPDD